MITPPITPTYRGKGKAAVSADKAPSVLIRPASPGGATKSTARLPAGTRTSRLMLQIKFYCFSPVFPLFSTLHLPKIEPELVASDTLTRGSSDCPLLAFSNTYYHNPTNISVGGDVFGDASFPGTVQVLSTGPCSLPQNRAKAYASSGNNIRAIIR